MSEGDSILELHLTITDQPQTALALLSANTPFSNGKIKSIMQKGAVWYSHHKTTERIRRAKRLLQTGEPLHLYYNPDVLDQQPPTATLIHDGVSYSVWNKPAGMLSQGSKWGDHTTLYRWAEQHLLPQRTAYIVHRLDRAAHGLILLAHNKRSTAHLATQFQQRTVEKIYHATIHGLLQPTHPSLKVTTPIDGKEACSHIKVVRQNAALHQTDVEVRIESGRKHQIRRHLSEIGYPIVGDRLYGQHEENGDLLLCSYSLQFNSPNSGERRRFIVSSSVDQPNSASTHSHSSPAGDDVPEF